MENNKSQFKRTGVLHDGGGVECIEIQISHSARCGKVCEHNHVHSKGPRGHKRPLARDTLQQEKRLCVYCEIRQEIIFLEISKNIRQQELNVK